MPSCGRGGLQCNAKLCSKLDSGFEAAASTGYAQMSWNILSGVTDPCTTMRNRVKAAQLRWLFGLSTALLLSACGNSGDGTPSEGNVAGTTSGVGGEGPLGSAGGPSPGPAADGDSSLGGSSGGAADPGGTSPSAGGNATTDETSNAPNTGQTGAGGGEGSTGDTSVEETGGGSTSLDEKTTGVSGTDTSGGATGSSGEETSTDEEPSSTECTRDFLDGLIDDYFAALAAGDPSQLPLADGVKFTENAEPSEVGATDFWVNAGEVKYSQRLLDTEACSVAVQAVVPESGTDLPIGLRIKAEGGQMTEIESIVVRENDYTASYSVDSEPQVIIQLADQIGWHDEVPEAQRASREEIRSWLDKYLRQFPDGVCNVTQSCRRLENGGGDFQCTTGAGCSQNQPGDGGVMIPRLILVDEVRGIGAVLTIFDFFGASGHLDMHMIKMSGGQVHAVQAILRDTGGQSGWD